ncbi:MAG: hypothetical protein IPJ47_10700 [Anaerolineales bacterium]|nr:hypothetical protein [Anaerolineales bacterium]
MNIRKHPRLILVLTALFALVCRCGSGPVETIPTTSDGVELTGCTTYLGGFEPSGIKCEVSCPSGKEWIEDPNGGSGFSDVTYAEVVAQACSRPCHNGNYLAACKKDLIVSAGSASSSSSSSRAAPTEEPTEEPAPTEAATDPAPLNPYLTGNFTTCDNAAGYVNFSIAENAPAYDPATFKVTFNGYPVNCAPAANNPSVLTCNYPPPSYAPPAGVQVFIGEELVNEFDFNGGAICDSAPQPNNPGSEDPQLEQPASTEPAATEPSSD